jgi:hypothetical protein
MADELKINIKIDERVDAYASFFDHSWSRAIDALVFGSKLEEPVFALSVNWKAAANAQLLPWLMMHSIKEFWRGNIEGQMSGSERSFWILAQQIPAAMRESLSNMKRKKLTEIINENAQRVKQAGEQEEQDLNTQALLSTFLKSRGGDELSLGIWGSQRIVYGAIFHAYENFVRCALGLARNEPDYRAFNIKTLVSDSKAAFGDETAKYCLTDDCVEVARLVRNALAHNGGKLTPELEKLAHGIEVVDGQLQIMPENNRKLFHQLKDRASKLAETALTMPQFK